MSTQTAGEKYLSIVCPVNKGIFEVTTAGSAGDFNGFTVAAGQARDAAQAAASAFSDKSIMWPAGIRPLLEEMKDEELALASFFNSLANARSFEEANSISTPISDGTAAQEVRLILGLTADTEASCKAY